MLKLNFFSPSSHVIPPTRCLSSTQKEILTRTLMIELTNLSYESSFHYYILMLDRLMFVDVLQDDVFCLRLNVIRVIPVSLNSSHLLWTTKETKKLNKKPTNIHPFELRQKGEGNRRPSGNRTFLIFWAVLKDSTSYLYQWRFLVILLVLVCKVFGSLSICYVPNRMERRDEKKGLPIFDGFEFDTVDVTLWLVML